MYYKQSTKIFEKIKKAKRILINIHPHPDPDSVGSALALSKVIKSLNITNLVRPHQIGHVVDLVSPEKIKQDFSYFKGFDKVKIIDFSTYDFSKYDLFLILDASSYDRVTGDKKIKLPNIPSVVIDHHQTNTIKSQLKLVDTKASATAEILYKNFIDWEVKIDRDSATFLFSGVAGDTNFFRTPRANAAVFEIASQLLKLGADKDLVIEKFYSSYELNFLKFLGNFLENLKLGEKGKFVWSAISYKEFLKLGAPISGQSPVADMFFNAVKGVNFGIAMLESERNEVNISIRSKPDTDISSLARKLGGGGHKNAAGATIFGNFSQIIKKVLKTAKNYLP